MNLMIRFLTSIRLGPPFWGLGLFFGLPAFRLRRRVENPLQDLVALSFLIGFGMNNPSPHVRLCHRQLKQLAGSLLRGTKNTLF